MTTTIRSFIAIDISTEARSTIANLQNRLKGLLPRHTVRWTSLDSMHLTLHFLGDVTPDSFDRIEESLMYTTASHSTFSLDLVGLGCFPNIRRPRILWVGIGGDTDPLVTLHRTLGQTLNQATGFTPERRPYAPHLTIGRIKKGLPSRQLAQIGQILVQEQIRVNHLARLTVSDITLMQSDLTPTGPIYTPLIRKQLTGIADRY